MSAAHHRAFASAFFFNLAICVEVRRFYRLLYFQKMHKLPDSYMYSKMFDSKKQLKTTRGWFSRSSSIPQQFPRDKAWVSHTTPNGLNGWSQGAGLPNDGRKTQLRINESLLLNIGRYSKIKNGAETQQAGFNG